MKRCLSTLKKYDVTQKILETLVDVNSRAILFSTVKKGKTGLELFDEYRIPMSSIYKKISELESLGLIYVEKRIISDSGKKFRVYRSRISGADIMLRSFEPTVNLCPN